ncbi:27270_t:CDS:2, partial [Racocetra persica]
LWIDNGPVTMLSTVHNITGSKSQVNCWCRRLQETSSNAKKVREIFCSSSRKQLPIPKLVNNYNHYMGDSEEFCTHLVWELIQASVSQVPNTRNSQYSITNLPVSN